jgi:2'-5' RNA ligase
MILQKIGQVQEDLKSSHADVRWVSPEKIHLTLRFFGNIDESRIETIVQSIREPIQTTSPFPLRAKGIGVFPHLKNPRVIWIGLLDEKKVLVSFQKRMGEELDKIGFESEDRPFQAHLTLGRVKSSRGKEGLIEKVERCKETEIGDFQVDRVILFRSDLRPTGPIYTPLRELRLGNH